MAERIAVLGAAGYAGAVAARLVHRHPRFELAHVTARSDAGARLDEVHPRTRVPLVLEEYDVDRHADRVGPGQAVALVTHHAQEDEHREQDAHQHGYQHERPVGHAARATDHRSVTAAVPAATPRSSIFS